MAKTLVGMPNYYAEEWGVAPDQPLYLMLNLATGCSLRCPKCALPGRMRKSIGPVLGQAERERMMLLAAQAGFKALVIIGAGEPTENFSLLREVVGKASEIGLDTVLFSTAARLDQEQAEFYATHKTTFIVSLDSLVPSKYRQLTGNGNLGQVINNINLLRLHYLMQEQGRALRLAINTTVVKQNVDELETIKRFTSDMLFVANAPIRRGKFAPEKVWREYVGDDKDYEELTRLAAQVSETGSHSSTFRGVCGYFSRGIAIDVDGAVLSCGYASETAGSLGHATDLREPKDLLELNRRVQARFQTFSRQVNRVPSCPLRDPEVETFIKLMRG